jgi:signal transduction histidine kinase
MAAVGQMVSAVAHEVRNPLTNITMGLDTLKQLVKGDEEKLEICAEVGYGVGVLRKLVDELLDYSKPVKLHYTYCSIDSLIKDALRRISSKHVATCMELKQPDKKVSLDPERMVRVLVNLIANALEAMPEGGTLKIASEYSGSSGQSFLTLRISDTGFGMDEGTLQNIQAPFFSTKAKGTGLGLAICRKIIMAHNGTFSIRSKPNQGTTVEIILPSETA